MTTPLSHAHGRSYAVFGLARSGIATARALLAGGAAVACWDDGAASREVASKEGLTLVDLTTADWTRFQSLVLAPGVPLTHPAPHWTVERAKAAGVEIIGDIELFFRERDAVSPKSPVVAITGTNGKSTTTALIAHILSAAGRDVAMGGNIGVGVLALPPPSLDRIHVLELSSFQIDLTPSLQPTIGILLNITPDHLDRHGTMENYAAIKARVVQSANLSVIGLDDTPSRAVFCDLKSAGVQTQTISDGSHPGADVFYRDGRIYTTAADSAALVDLRDIRTLRGRHNGQNAAAAYAACAPLLGADLSALFASFPGLPHRLEQIGRIGRVLIINDSKATNADSTEKALSSFSRDIHWIVGGVQKEGGIAALGNYFDRITKAYLIGKSTPEFSATLQGKVPFEDCKTLDAAFAAAVRDAEVSPAAEPIILLSPACASYDQYKSFEHRGDHFRALAQGWPGFATG